MLEFTTMEDGGKPRATIKFQDFVQITLLLPISHVWFLTLLSVNKAVLKATLNAQNISDISSLQALFHSKHLSCIKA